MAKGNARKCSRHLSEKMADEALHRLEKLFLRIGANCRPISRSVGHSKNVLEKLFPRIAQIVELRYFIGLSEEQAADVLRLSSRTIRRD